MSSFWERLRTFFTVESPDYAALWAVAEPKLAGERRDAWLPRCAPSPEGGRSQFGGRPLVEPGGTWPECPKCARALALIVQIDSNDVPEPARDAFPEGVLQVLYCTRCWPWQPFDPCQQVRVLPAVATLRPAPGDAPPAHIACSHIVGWTRVDDYPEPDDGLSSPGVLDELEVESLFENGFPRHGDKLGGWPAWVQDPARPPCPDCGAPTHLLVQVDSNDNLDLMWGDAGIAHVFWCPAHPARMTLDWAGH